MIPLHNLMSFSWQGGHTFTSKSLKDGFYSNWHTTIQCHTKTTLNQNYDHHARYLNGAQATTKPLKKSTYQIHPENSKSSIHTSKKTTNQTSQSSQNQTHTHDTTFCVNELVNIAKIAKMEVNKINSKQTTIKCREIISKYITLLNTNARHIHKNSSKIKCKYA